MPLLKPQAMTGVSRRLPPIHGAFPLNQSEMPLLKLHQLNLAARKKRKTIL